MATVVAPDAPQPGGSTRPASFRPRRLVGRDREIAEVTDCLVSSPVTTLTGPGGVGKTALAMTVATGCAQDFPGGVIVVWLAPLRSAELVVAEVATAVGLPKSGGQSYEDALTHWLAEKDILLLLDNCEHVVSAVADLVDALTARLPRLRVLATSREPLWVDGEVSYRLSPLPVARPDASFEEVAASPAVRLFQERADARVRGSLGTERAGRLLAEICRRVDGLPLAIELAAARVAGLDLEDITSHMGDLFHLLPQPAGRADGVQRSLRATVEWSDALLTEEERRLLRRMAAFSGDGAIRGCRAIQVSGLVRRAPFRASRRLVEMADLARHAPVRRGGPRVHSLCEPDGRIIVEQLRVADVPTGDLLAPVSVCRMIASSLFPFFAAVVARPQRREWPTTVFGSMPARSAARCTISATLLSLSAAAPPCPCWSIRRNRGPSATPLASSQAGRSIGRWRPHFRRLASTPATISRA